MTMSLAHAPSSRRLDGLLPFWVGIGVYALLLAVGSGLLNDPDTYWQITLGQWMLDHHAVPRTDIYSFTMQGQPWISTQWLAQVAYALAYNLGGWAGPVVLAAASASLAIALLAGFLHARLARTPALVILAATLALMAGHMLARPHVLAMPVMVAWVAGLVDAMDRRSAPSFRLLPLMVLWANLHGGFVLGLALIGPIALDAIWHAPKERQARMLLRWILFGVAALAASCVTPYGWEALLASQRILGLGAALAVIGEWRPANFGKAGPLEFSVLAAFAFVLWRGITLPPMRIVLVLGFVYMALGHVRNAEVLALLAPLVLAKPLGEQLGQPEAAASAPNRLFLAGVALCLIAGTIVIASKRQYTPSERAAPIAAVDALKQLNVSRVFNDYDFGGYLIWRGVPTFIDGRTELFGEKLMVDHNDASGLAQPDNLFRLLKDYKIDATFMRTESAATKLLDRLDGWEKVYSDDLATIHVRKDGATGRVRE
ncbi:hypothetical protein E0H22_08570 [Rhodopseudomonas boonkerdii]|uniref:hypothetical protein n=1 Tax=Rhodopseudomonas boonkerdii TaxID=475937 RepID=UPI001E4BEEF4|nr:hypothetical protein [Rhodopseudomonas boonkerdii]UGV25733.1 hypothetical protein E0H22_08570 [Rhodopseudomonas boonkerdii]